MKVRTMVDDETVFEIHAAFCSVFSHPKRLHIMWLLGDGERCVSDLASELGASVANVSQHLTLMRAQGAVKTRKEGQTVFYRIANANFLEGARFIRRGLIEENRIAGDALANGTPEETLPASTG